MRPGGTQAGTNLLFFCTRLHETGTKRFVDYMRPVQTQKQEILVAI